MSKNKQIVVQGIGINVIIGHEDDFISLTDMVADKGGNDKIQNWVRNKDTIEFLGAWEQMHNPNFNSVEFHRIMYEAGTQRYTLSISQWVEKTKAIGIISKTGRTGGTYAYKDIAFHFGAHLSATFYLYLIKEFQRLKEIENHQYNLEWNVKRVLTKVNYKLHTDAIKANIIPKLNVTKEKEWVEYAKEADLLNVALFGTTASLWEQANPTLFLAGDNLRDSASINELAVLSNIESLNSVWINEGLTKGERFAKLKEIAQKQLTALNQQDFIKSLKHTSDSTYPLALEQKKKEDEKKSEFDKNLTGLLNVPKPPKD